MIINPKSIDFSKYRRFFAFGCSFTGYMWPTWADCLSKEIPNAEFYNMGYSGAGNLMISNRLTEANLKFNFNEHDLIMIMWSTFCREDRYINNYWKCPGNIYTQNTYNEEFVKKFADSKGYLIRDLAIISLTTTLINSLSSDSITLASIPYNYQNEDDSSIAPILKLHEKTIKITPRCLFELEMNRFWGTGHSYYDSLHNGIMNDYHPNPVQYRNYLEKIGIPMTEKSMTFAQESLAKLLQTKSNSEILNTFVNNSQGTAQFNGWF